MMQLSKNKQREKIMTSFIARNMFNAFSFIAVAIIAFYVYDNLMHELFELIALL